MSYHHTFIIVRPSLHNDSKCGKFWANIVSVFKLDYDWGLYDITKRYPETKYFVYDENENEVTTDKYDKPLTEVSLNDLIRDLETVNKRHPQIRTSALIAALHAYRYDPRGLVALHYGE